MNWFFLANTVLYFGAGVYEIYRGSLWMAGVFFGWAFSNVCLILGR